MYEPAPQIKVFWAILNGVVVQLIAPPAVELTLEIIVLFVLGFTAYSG